MILALRSGTLSARLLTDGTEAWTVKLAVDQPLGGRRRQDLRRRRRDAARTERRRRFERMESGSREAVCADSRAGRLGHRRRWRIRDCPARRRWRSDLEQERWSNLRAPGDRRRRPLPADRGGPAGRARSENWKRPVGPGSRSLADRAPGVRRPRLFRFRLEAVLQSSKRRSGREDWRWEVGTRIIGPAAADESRVYFTAMDNIVRALSRGNGGRRWAYPLAYRPTRGPVVIGGQVGVPGITTELPGLDATSGKATGKLTLPVLLAIGPSFVPPSGARRCAGRRHDHGRVDEPMDRVGVDA